MKVLMINVVCGIRSTGRICTDLANALEKQGHEVKIAYGRENVPEQFQKYAVRIGTDLDIKLHGIKARLFDKAGFGSKKATEKFIDWVKEYDPDIIHLHNIHGYYINIEILFAYLKVCGKKIIWTMHDCWALTGHSAYCDSSGCEKWKKGCGKCPQLREYPRAYVDNSKHNWIKKKNIFSNIPNMTIVTPSIWLENMVKQSYLKDIPIKVIYNGVDTSKFKPSRNDIKKCFNIEDKFMILGVATAWDDMKGLGDFIRLAGKLDASFQVVLVGLTEKQIKSLPNSIIGIKRTANVEELAQIYSAADVFVNLTYCDSYGLVNVEAALCGTPVISYDTGGCKESVGKHGVVVKKGDLDSIIRIIKDRKNESKKIEINAQIYDTKRYLEESMSVYRESIV